MRLKQLLKDVPLRTKQIPDIDIKGISYRSDIIKPGQLFVAISGNSVNGHDYISTALKKKAAAVIGEKPLPNLPRYIRVEDSRKALAILAANFYQHPAKQLKIIGITGTNGKTTTSYLVESIIKTAAFLPARIGTINYKIGGEEYPAAHTTPDALFLQNLFSRMLQRRNDYCVMEVSSHALDQGRVYGIDFSVGVFTNLTRDHLDYHKDFTGYFKAKKILFNNLGAPAAAVINIDDFYGKKMLTETTARLFTYGLDAAADVRLLRKKNDLLRSELYIATPRGVLAIATPLVGDHNIYNILAAAATGICLGFNLEVIKRGIEAIKFVPGRLQSVDAGQRFRVFVDYAHTDDALKNVLECVRNMRPRRVIVVFGCGGDRDRSKRPLMGNIASELADFVVVTSDNPRNENPEDIAADILKGIFRRRHKCLTILDRYEAIKKALSLARDNDVVLIAGKGHETKQVVKGESFDFNDVQVANEILKVMSYRL